MPRYFQVYEAAQRFRVELREVMGLDRFTQVKLLAAYEALEAALDATDSE